MYPNSLAIIRELEKEAKKLRISYSCCCSEDCINLYSQTDWESQHITRLYWYLNQADNGVFCRVLEAPSNKIMSIKICVDG